MLLKGHMDKKITFRHMTHSDVMENYINQQFAKIESFLRTEKEPIFVEIVLEPSKIHAHHRVEIRVKTPQYFLVNDYEGPEFYAVLDRVLDIMYDRLHEKKREIVNQRKDGLKKRE